MTHYVLLKFQESYLTDEKFAQLQRDFSEVCDAVEGISCCKVRRNVIKRDANMDVMVSFQAVDADALMRYLKHPLHQNIGKQNDPYVVSRVSFDA